MNINWEKELDAWYNNLDENERIELENKHRQKMKKGYWNGFSICLWGIPIILIIGLVTKSIGLW